MKRREEAEQADALDALIDGALAAAREKSADAAGVEAPPTEGESGEELPIWRSLRSGDICLVRRWGGGKDRCRCSITAVTHQGYENARYRVQPDSGGPSFEVGTGEVRIPCPPPCPMPAPPCAIPEDRARARSERIVPHLHDTGGTGDRPAMCA